MDVSEWEDGTTNNAVVGKAEVGSLVGPDYTKYGWQNPYCWTCVNQPYETCVPGLPFGPAALEGGTGFGN